MNENFEHTIELIGGYTDKNEITHKEVTFGYRMNGLDVMNLDTDPQAKNPTQYNDLVRRKMITKFGTTAMPVPLTALLSLDSIDRDDLTTAAEKFLIGSRGERNSEFKSFDKVKLAFGFVIDGTEYDVISFGNRISGKDFVEADIFGNGIAQTCFLIGKQISRISTSDGTASIDGQVSLDQFNTLDAESISILRAGAELFRQSFRFKRETLSNERNGDGSIPVDAGTKTLGK